MRTSRNNRLFALPSTPPEKLDLPGGRYRLGHVFKHDFFAATCLYELVSESAPEVIPKIVVKFGRSQEFMGLPCAWYAHFMQAHEKAIYHALAGLDGVPRWAGDIGKTAYAIEYIDARPLDHLEKPPAGFFDKLMSLLEKIHARGVAYVDANKRSNILVTDDGKPYIIDFQISFRLRDDLPRPIRSIIAWAFNYIIKRDVYHFLKHKRRLSPEELTAEEDTLSRQRTGIHTLHRKLTKPYRNLRRKFLHKQQKSGLLTSPTEKLETHNQPEKATWRDEKKT